MLMSLTGMQWSWHRNVIATEEGDAAKLIMLAVIPHATNGATTDI